MAMTVRRRMLLGTDPIIPLASYRLLVLLSLLLVAQYLGQFVVVLSILHSCEPARILAAKKSTTALEKPVSHIH